MLGSRRNAVENSSRRTSVAHWPSFTFFGFSALAADNNNTNPRFPQQGSVFATVCIATHPVPEMPLISTDAGTMEMPEALIDLRSIDELI